MYLLHVPVATEILERASSRASSGAGLRVVNVAPGPAAQGLRARELGDLWSLDRFIPSGLGLIMCEVPDGSSRESLSCLAGSGRESPPSPPTDPYVPN